MTITFVDPAKAVRDWLRDQAGTLGVTSANVNLGTTDTTDAQIVVFRVGGGDDSSDAEVDRPMLQIDVWHPTSYNTASNVKNKVRAALKGLRPSALNSATFGYGAFVVSEVFLPDRETNAVRFALTVELTTRAI